MRRDDAKAVLHNPPHKSFLWMSFDKRLHRREQKRVMRDDHIEPPSNGFRKYVIRQLQAAQDPGDSGVVVSDLQARVVPRLSEMCRR